MYVLWLFRGIAFYVISAIKKSISRDVRKDGLDLTHLEILGCYFNQQLILFI